MSGRYPLLLFASSNFFSRNQTWQRKNHHVRRVSHCHFWVPGGTFRPIDELPEVQDTTEDINSIQWFKCPSLINTEDRSWCCLFHSCTIQRRLWLKLCIWLKTSWFRMVSRPIVFLNKIFMDFLRNDWFAGGLPSVYPGWSKNLSHIRGSGNALCLACTVAKSW